MSLKYNKLRSILLRLHMLGKLVIIGRCYLDLAMTWMYLVMLGSSSCRDIFVICGIDLFSSHVQSLIWKLTPSMTFVKVEFTEIGFLKILVLSSTIGTTPVERRPSTVGCFHSCLLSFLWNLWCHFIYGRPFINYWLDFLDFWLHSLSLGIIRIVLSLLVCAMSRTFCYDNLISIVTFRVYLIESNAVYF